MTADDEVLRLRAEVAQARLDALKAKLAAAEARTDAPTSAPTDSRLSAPPRHVPMTYRLLILPFSWYVLFSLFLVTIPPIIVWIGVPEFGIVGVFLTVVVVLGLRVRKHFRQLGLLTWGEVGTVVGSELIDVGTYYSGMTYNNMRVPIAHGWDVDRGFYNGPGTKQRIRYSLNGTEGSLVLRGRGYEDGIILVNSRNPQIAACVSSFAYDLRRTPSGDWSGEVGTKAVLGAILMAVLFVGWAVGALYVLNVIRGVTPQLFG